MMTKSKTFTLYLVKENVVAFEDALSSTAIDRIKAGSATVRNSERLGDRSTAFIFEGTPHPPSWLADLAAVFGNLPNIKNATSCSIVAFKNKQRIFLISFGHGWQHIDESKIEPDFGLKVAINSPTDTKIKRVDRSNLGEAIKGVSQSAFQRDLQAFGLDEALDQVRRITARSDDEFASNLAGSTSLKITREMVLSDIVSISEEALLRFHSGRYKNTIFHIIDKVRPILDRQILKELDETAVKLIKDGENNFELSMPGWSDEDVVYYGFSGLRLQKRFPDLLMENYRAALGRDIVNLEPESIVSKHGVFAEFANDSMAKKRWSIKKALIGSVILDGGLYAISEGEWYRFDTQFKDDVEASFKELIDGWDNPPLKIIRKVSDDGKRIGFESEFDYNKRSASYYGQICLDQEILEVPAIPFGKFEACDLLDVEKKKFIHVKKSSRQSSILSHFFKQGSNSSKILKTFREARLALVDKVRSLAGNHIGDELARKLGNSLEDWTVEFHIIDAARSDGTYTVPFFSRISLRDEARMLKGMALGVVVRFIPT